VLVHLATCETVISVAAVVITSRSRRFLVAVHRLWLYSHQLGAVPIGDRLTTSSMLTATTSTTATEMAIRARKYQVKITWFMFGNQHDGVY
jgi:hypothetical protein